ncbi:hypothetical protein HY489_05090 [Candidatus Woesearchaeota archaeon]|nr:hypothetical protein [Candidatus Woesearchaeota archaeon]
MKRHHSEPLKGKLLVITNVEAPPTYVSDQELDPVSNAKKTVTRRVIPAHVEEHPIVYASINPYDLVEFERAQPNRTEQWRDASDEFERQDRKNPDTAPVFLKLLAERPKARYDVTIITPHTNRLAYRVMLDEVRNYFKQHAQQRTPEKVAQDFVVIHSRLTRLEQAGLIATLERLLEDQKMPPYFDALQRIVQHPGATPQVIANYVQLMGLAAQGIDIYEPKRNISRLVLNGSNQRYHEN